MVIMKKHITRTMLATLLLLAGGMTNRAWADIKVTYHIITLPFDNLLTTGTVESYRIEALKCDTTWTTASATISLPYAYRSPLAMNYKYWNAASVSSKAADVKVHSPNNSTYTNYGGCSLTGAGDYTEGTSTVTENTDVYVTYEYNSSNNICDLSGSSEYTIDLGDAFLAYNFTRNDRPGEVAHASVSSDNLLSDEYVSINGTSYYFRWKFTGSDPYNIGIYSAYDGRDASKHNSRLFSRFGYNMWLTAQSKKYSSTDMQQDLYDSFILLNHANGVSGNFALMASAFVEMKSSGYRAPNSSGQYPWLTYNASNPQATFKAAAMASVVELFKIKTYTYKVKTPLSNSTVKATAEMSGYMDSEEVMNHIPDSLRRKYVSFTGAYTTDGFSTPVTTFADVDAADNGGEIWLDYSVSSSMPFDTLAAASGVYDYKNARWYTMRVNGKAEAKNIAYNSSGNLITGSTSTGSETDLHQGENTVDAQVAFIGDPFELKIISRAASETAGASRYIGCATDAADGTTLNTNKTGSDDISSWEIVYESSDMDNFILRQLNTIESPKYIGWNSGTTNKPVTYSTSSTRIRVVELNKVPYTYYIVRNDAGDIAVKATVSQDVGKVLRQGTDAWQDIPEIIRSPFLSTATVTYYASLDNAKAKTPALTNAPYNSSGADIYVRYIYAEAPTASTYNVRLNVDYIYTDGDDIKNKTIISDAEREGDAFQWTLDYSDPYAMTIKNKGNGKYIKIASWENEATISWDAAEANASLFIAKSGAIAGTYEAMAATGTSVDASTTYYNIGRPSDNTVKLYSNSSYLHGNITLRFQFSSPSAIDRTYHLIDKSGKDLLQAGIRQTNTDVPTFPPRYHSPLVSAYHYYKLSDFNVSSETYTLKDAVTEMDTIRAETDIYVTYDVNNLVNLNSGQIYLLKYESGETFHQEDGGDALNATAQKAVYPYVNGDCNFFVYGDEQYEIQQQGAASTRTRWVWYVESANNDPYHVTIKSRQSETYNGSERNAFFKTYVPDGYSQVVTTLAWPGISGETATEYMVLGSVGQYQLATTDSIDDGTTKEHRIVNSFEQYWKTFDTIRKKVYGESSAKANASDPLTIPATTKTKYNGVTENLLRDSLQTTLEWHCYDQWAYAKRWNGTNSAGASSKGWEMIEHWYQTISMGEGYFDFVTTNIDPAMILLDQHGWEIMRKPLPSGPDDPEKDAKYAAIRTYNSPMVKEYAFWATAKKRSGFHQYYLLSARVGGDTFTSADLTDLPPLTSENVHDKKGNLNDQYVTYIVKDEYAQSYNPADKTALPFLIEQGTKYASTTDGTTITKNDVSSVVSMPKHIVNGPVTDAEKWYVKPNDRIDYEMGYDDAAHSWGTTNPNAYEDATYDYGTARKASYISESAAVKLYGNFAFSNGFDPYNIQITPYSYETKFMKTNATGATLEDGSMNGTYSTTEAVSLGDTTVTVTATWFDNRRLAITNATFMAVQDAEGNMQLMPRFDHNLRMSEFGTLKDPSDAGVESTYTKLYRPIVYQYLIIDNDGKESLRYKTGGDLVPQIPDHFKSPLATDYTFYATATYSDGTYSNITDEITESLDGATLDSDTVVYVRYEYDEAADTLKMLQGNWLTMKLDNKDTKLNSGIKQGTGKPATIDSDDGEWQWKFLETPQSKPDPYAAYIFNRNDKGVKQADGTRFAILSHTSGDYALAKAGLESNDTYQFLNGTSMNTETAAETATEANFTSSDGTFSGTGSQAKFSNEVSHTFIYRVVTKGMKYAIDKSQSLDEVVSNEWVPLLPDGARSPLLNIEDYLYYNKDDFTITAGAIASADTIGKKLSHLYGLYEDTVYVRYTPYDELRTNYKVPNVKTTEDSHVAKDSSSNDTPLGLGGTLLYNIIWYNDNMMKKNDDGTAVADGGSHDLTSDAAYEWTLEGEDPYAIKIKSKGADKYIHEASSTATELSETATTFMLLNKDDYDYGILTKTGSAVTGATPVMLSGYGQSLTASDPTEFIIFALATYKVIYHLMIKNIGEDVRIPYKGTETGNVLQPSYSITTGTTQRDLTTKDDDETGVAGDKYQLGLNLRTIATALEGGGNDLYKDSLYCYDAGSISLGDVLEVPAALYRPNVTYNYYVEGIYSSSGVAQTDLNSQYKGSEVDEMATDAALLGKIVLINVVYSFDGILATNTGDRFVTDVSQKRWYSFETSDGTPWMAQYTHTRGIIADSGHDAHYTNDFLWSPVGDPYGFKMYNRYAYKNDEATTQVMTTAAAPSAGASLIMQATGSNNGNDVYELLSDEGTTDGYFKVHPVANNSGTQYYVNNSSGTVTLSTSATEWKFGLGDYLLQPYRDRAGYVGGLNADGKAAYDDAGGDWQDIQLIVYDDDNIVTYTPGYYRIHSQPAASGISTPRYASGYTHDIEKTAVSGGIPMHFYELNSSTARTFEDLSSGFTVTNATRGEIPVLPVTNDPASIFQFSGNASAAKMSTQGLYVKENKMTTASGEATEFRIVDIGGAIVLIYRISAAPADTSYLNCDQSSNIYDMKFSKPSTTDYDRWCMQPVQKGATAGDGEMGLRVTTHDGGDNHYYATFCAPFDALLTSAANDTAYIVPRWTSAAVHPKPIGNSLTAASGCPEDYRGCHQFIPAGTPVIIRTKSTTGYVTLALPATTPSSTTVSSVLTGKYLEQMLPHGSDYVYVLGREDSGTFTESAEFATNGEITAVLPNANGAMGFYKNATPNKEKDIDDARWTRNNKYVYGNKIYYRASEASAAPNSLNLELETPQYIPIVFGDDDEMLLSDDTGMTTYGDGRVYDLQGRCVATEQQVSDGTWQTLLKPGMYIVNGKKIIVK